MHWLVEHTVSPFDLDTTIKEHALATAHEKAVELTSDRLINLEAACLEVERWVERLLWRAPSGTLGGARRVTSIVEVFAANQPIPVAPQFPSTAGVVVTVQAVGQWSEAAEQFEDTPYRVLPAGRIKVATVGTIEIIADLLPATPAPVLAIEGAARLWAYRELLRPVAEVDGLTGTGSLSAAMFRSGASGILRSLKQRGQS